MRHHIFRKIRHFQLVITKCTRYGQHAIDSIIEDCPTSFHDPLRFIGICRLVVRLGCKSDSKTSTAYHCTCITKMCSVDRSGGWRLANGGGLFLEQAATRRASGLSDARAMHRPICDAKGPYECIGYVVWRLVHLLQQVVMQVLCHIVNALTTTMPVVDSKVRRVLLATKAIYKDETILHLISPPDVISPAHADSGAAIIGISHETSYHTG
mmetsp:Transcript_3470/g.8645  ORF Transcript_3470/g.8645 Transcript_3470/m.8645 type:complete len:211 (-) Transcript_3470:26-658(-)